MVYGLRALLDKISLFLSLSSTRNLYSNPAHKYYTKWENIAKLLKPVLENLVGFDAASGALLSNGFEQLAQNVDELRKQFESWRTLSSRIFYVLRVESLASKLSESGLEVFQLLKRCQRHLPPELFSPSFEECIELVKLARREEISNLIDQALIDQREGVGPNSEVMVKIAESVGLRSNKEILIEGVLLSNMKMNAAELTEKNIRIEFVVGLISLITSIHGYLIKITHSEFPLPPDFSCPLSLELMTDPVIVASGQTYERVYIENWMEMGLMYCPKTRLPLSHTTLTPNFIVKAFTDSWCKSNNVSPPDPLDLIHSTQPFPLLFDSDDSLKCDEKASSSTSEDPSIIENSSLDATKCEEPRQVLSRSTSAPGIVSQVVSKTGRTTNKIETAWPIPSVKHFRHRGIIPATIRESGSSCSSMETEVKKLIEDLKNPCVDTQREAAARMRILSRISTENCIVIAKSGAINMLVNLLHSTDGRIQAEAVTSLLNLAIQNENKSIIMESGAIGPLIHILKEGRLVEAKENSAATLFLLSSNERNKKRIAKAGAIEPLVDLLGKGSLIAKKDASSVLFNLTTRHENKAKAIKAGAVRHLVEMMDPAGGLVEKAAALLANLATITEGTIAIAEDERAIPMLVEVVELCSGRGKEHAVVCLWLLCVHDSRFCYNVIREGAIPPLVALYKSGTVRAREKAHSLLICFKAHKQSYQRRR